VSVGFIGTGKMGFPMAANLLRAGIELVVWNRTAGKSQPLAAQGARLASSVPELMGAASTVLVMLANEAAIDATFGRGTPVFDQLLRDRRLVNLGTTSAGYSRQLEQDVIRAGGLYVEAPVSGSREPAVRGALVGMFSGSPAAIQGVELLLSPLCTRMFACGPVPHALRTKLAVNHFLITMVAALGETVHAARAAGIDLSVLQDVLDAGPMASDVSRTKLAKLVRGDFSPQASLHDAGTIAELALAQATQAGAPAPLMQACVSLYQGARQAGWSDLDMIAATRTLEAPAPTAPRHTHAR
jgi:3-hydroxyisobutyrate dehydrogenase